MMTGTITDDQARALAQFVATLRPRELRWDVPGVRAALSQARHRGSIDELAVAAIRAAMVLENRTPAVIALDGPHWHTQGTSTAVVSARAERCPEPGHGSYFAWNCGACHADRVAAESDQADALVRQGVPRERVRQILAEHGARRPDARQLAAGEHDRHEIHPDGEEVPR